jgi:hypothetical protein
VDLPLPLDDPERLAQWDAIPRLQVCGLALLAGMCFSVNQNKESVTLGFVDLDRKPLKDYSLVRLVRPSKAVFRQQLDLVANYAELREERASEILTQMVPQVPFWASIVGLQAHRHKWTLELVALSLSLASHVEMRFKHAFACPRPVELSPQIQPMIPTPGHASWPCGHATEAYMVSGILQALLPNGATYGEQLERQAARISVNRTVAGLHYQVDNAVGRLLGAALAEFFVARCIRNAKLHERGFIGPNFHGPKNTVIDFDPRVSMTDNKSGYYEYDKSPISNGKSPSSTGSVACSPLLAFMWAEAAKEWQSLK